MDSQNFLISSLLAAAHSLLVHPSFSLFQCSVGIPTKNKPNQRKSFREKQNLRRQAIKRAREINKINYY